MQGKGSHRIFLILVVLISCTGYASCQDSLYIKSLQDSFLRNVFQNPEVAMGYAKRLDSIATEMNDSTSLGVAWNYQGMAYNVMGDASPAIEKFLAAMRYFEALKDEYHQGVILNNLGVAHNLLNETEKTIAYYEKALTKFRALGDSAWLPRLLYNISTQKNGLGLYAEDLRLKSEVYAILRLKPNPSLEVTLKPNYAHTLYSLGRFEEAHDSIRAYVENPEYQTNQSIYSNALLTYAFVLDTMGKTQEALVVTKKALAIADSLGFAEKSMKAHGHLAKLYGKMGDFRSAYHSMTTFHHAYEDLFNAERDEALNELLVRYDTEKKENEIALLNSENALQDERIARASIVRYVLIAGILLACVLAFLAWRMQRIKSKTNAQLNDLNLRLSKALEGKNILLKEIHHRVKNNLQVISSLLKLQSKHITDETAVKAIAEGRNRVQSMALLHQNLYRDDQLTGVDMQVYFKSLVESLFDAYQVDTNTVQLTTDISPLVLDIDTVIPLGLIANELVSNALKHAFHGQEKGVLHVALWEREGSLWLKVRDNGNGYIRDENAKQGSFGTKLIQLLSDRIQGELNITSNHGTEVVLEIRDYQKAA